MLQTAFVVFREFIEISLLISIFSAYAKDIKNFRYILFGGIFLGTIGAVFLAFLTNYLSDSFDGMSQEIINISIIMLTVVMIGWTIIWMQSHSKKIKASFHNITEKMQKNEVGSVVLVLLIASVIFREGSEIVMLLSSISLSLKSGLHDLFIGFVLGAISGTLLGVLIYIGLLKFATKYLFKFITFIMTFICAGLSLEAAGIMTSSGMVTVLSRQVWSTESIIPNNSIFAQILNILFGYTSSPNGLQILFYIATIIVILFFSNYVKNKQNIIIK